jgi:hypothetical protein
MTDVIYSGMHAGFPGFRLQSINQLAAINAMGLFDFFAGLWTDNPLRKTFRVIDVPTTLIIDPDGKIAQIDLFNATLKNFISKLLKAQLP